MREKLFQRFFFGIDRVTNAVKRVVRDFFNIVTGGFTVW